MKILLVGVVLSTSEAGTAERPKDVPREKTGIELFMAVVPRGTPLVRAERHVIVRITSGPFDGDVVAEITGPARIKRQRYTVSYSNGKFDPGTRRKEFEIEATETGTVKVRLIATHSVFGLIPGARSDPKPDRPDTTYELHFF